MFHNVDRDCDVIEYDKYVLKLRDDLREALLSALVNADIRRQHQAVVFNRRTMAMRLWRETKLADRWESVQFVVVSRDPKCHTYRIKNTSSGHERAVQRNLLQCAT